MTPPIRSLLRCALVCAAALTLAACGFHLRGAANLPFKTLYISLPEVSELRAAIARSVTAGSDTQVVGEGEATEAILEITGDQFAKNVLSLSSSGRVREYQLVRSVNFRVHNGKGTELLPPGTITLRRDVSFSDDQLLAKEQEEVLLRRDMQNDLVQQLLRRLSAAKPGGVKDY